MTKMIRFKKTVTSMGKVRRFVEIPAEYYKIIQTGDQVTIEAKDKDERNEIY